MAKRGLGRGLEALISSTAATEGSRLEELPVQDIRPNPLQPRRNFDQEALEGMAQSVREFGVMQPVIVRPMGAEYELIAGERRWRAAKEAGLDKVPAIVRESTETSSLEMALIENLHREDLNGIEEASAYQQLLEDFGITHEELSRRLGKSRSAISNTIRLLGLPISIRKMMVEGSLSSGHARALLALEDSEGQEKLANRAVRGALSVRQLEGLIRRAKMGAVPKGKERELPPRAQRAELKLQEHLDARVRIHLGKRKGKIIIDFKGIDHLERLTGVIAGDEAGSDEAGSSDEE